MTARCQAPTCNRPLRTDESKLRGMGPVCWRRVHGAPPAPRGLASHHHLPAADTHPVDPDQIPLPLEVPVDAETRKASIDTIARHAIGRALAHDVTPEWADYPELDLNDWKAVVVRIQAIGKSLEPSDEGYKAAYEHLTTETTVREGQNQ